MSTAVFAPGGYRFIPAVFQYSGGVAAERGFEIVRVRFHEPAPLAEGFARIEQVIRAAGRPLTAFCACELRSGAPFTEDGFRELARRSAALAPRCAAVLEGGYNLSTLPRLVAAALEGFS